MTIPHPQRTCPCTSTPLSDGRRRALRDMWATYWGNLHTRRQLLELSDGQLRDVGLTRGQALREAWQPVWRNTAQQQSSQLVTGHERKKDGTPYAAIA